MSAPKYDWPETEGLVAFVRKHGPVEAAERLGVKRETLTCHLRRQGIHADEYSPRRKLNEDALEEIRNLIT